MRMIVSFSVYLKLTKGVRMFHQRRTMRSYSRRILATSFRFLGRVNPFDWPKNPSSLMEILKSRNVIVSGLASRVIDNMSFEQDKFQENDLVAVPSLSLNGASTIHDIVEAGKSKFDFDPCSVGLALMARLTYNNQPPEEQRFYVAMKPVRILGGPHILKMFIYKKRSGSNELWIDAEYAGSGTCLFGEFLFSERVPIRI